MDATNNHIHSRRAVNGITMFRGTVMVGLLISTFLTALPSITFADGRDGDRKDDKGRHSLVQHPYVQPPQIARNPFVAMQAQIDALKTQVDQLTLNMSKLPTPVALGTMQTDVAALNTKAVDIIPGLADYLKVDKTTVLQGVKGPHILFTGVNVHVRSGSGFTNDNGGTLTGLGNLIIGYNEDTSPTATLASARKGSHNLVGGSVNSFSSFGGMVFGYQNAVGPVAPYGSVLGGSENKALGINSTVYGGLTQTAGNLNSYAPVQAPVQGAKPLPGGQ
jgi:hypothetical protein